MDKYFAYGYYNRGRAPIQKNSTKGWTIWGIGKNAFQALNDGVYQMKRDLKDFNGEVPWSFIEEANHCQIIPCTEELYNWLKKSHGNEVPAEMNAGSLQLIPIERR